MGRIILDKSLLEHLEYLARIELSEEREKFLEQLNSILNYVKKIDELDLKNVEPFTYPTNQVLQCRQDIPQKSLTPSEVLQNAPDKEFTLFKLPKVIE